MRTYLILLMLCALVNACSNEAPPNPEWLEDQIATIVELPDELNEHSGMLALTDSTLLGHNDSGDDPILYEFDASTKKLIRRIHVLQADHKDWEELAQDEDYIYIGDFGNNRGARTDLVIYKVQKSELLQSDSVNAQIIAFSYPDQSDFSERSKHRFDCEAMIALGDQLYLFTKNRDDAKTNLYQLDKTPGTQVATPKSAFDVSGQITAADLAVDSSDVLALLGYDYQEGHFRPFIWLFYDFEGTSFFDGQSKRIDLAFQRQTEALCFRGSAKELVFSNEEEKENKGYVYGFDVAKWLD